MRYQLIKQANYHRFINSKTSRCKAHVFSPSILIISALVSIELKITGSNLIDTNTKMR